MRASTGAERPGVRGREIRVEPVDGRRRISDFIRTTRLVYRDDPAWIQPLGLERRLHLSDHNPFFDHASWQGWVAYLDARPVGRITAQIDELVLRHQDEELGHFGFLEAVDVPAVFDALFEVAEEWLRDRGMRRIRGPFNFSINQECGILVEGFEHPPQVMMGHGRPYYQNHLDRQGYRPAKDLFAYWIDGPFDVPPVMRALLRRYDDRIRVRPLRSDRLEAELELMRDIFNDAWADNWGFVPFTEAEFRELGKLLHLFVNDELVQLAEVDGEAAAFLVGVPNLNEAIRDLDGRLLPFGWAKLLWRVLRNRIRTGRIPLVGVRSRYQNTPLGAALALLVIGAIQEPGLERGMREAELSWILEENRGMRGILEMVGAEPYKRYRIFEKTLSATSTKAS